MDLPLEKLSKITSASLTIAFSVSLEIEPQVVLSSVDSGLPHSRCWTSRESILAPWALSTTTLTTTPP